MQNVRPGAEVPSPYNLTHRNMRIYLDEDNGRVYVIERRG